MELINFRGEIAALGAAFLWAVSTLMFGRLGKQLVPLLLNFVKGSMALGFILLTLLWRTQSAPELPLFSVLFLLLSGVIGIGLGDTAYFAALNHLGPRRVLLMEALAPPMSALLALLFLQERLPAIAWVGITLSVGGVAWVITERVPDVHPQGENLPRGVTLGLLAALGQAVGAVLSRAALADTAVDPLWSTLLRLGAGLVCMLALLRARPQAGGGWPALRSPLLLGGVAIAAFLGTYLAIWLQQTALKYSPTGIAQSLTATSPLFILPMALLLGERISARAVLGALVAIAGVWLLL
ncbi:DMT family transporter [Romeria aff. gracilis LEGE 07310]|uniref:DMT family transporter n=1 Tax=Vasconcelosia minhoensis LEGE 07310 TaxID=915328 RepID=A0A8J7DBA7_9CYAN|nr:DMT family transporter [Romeria gracilis]MBE9077452.1 DMT family transporter [Romeria aff. gracilis LEGE 07310]